MSGLSPQVAPSDGPSPADSEDARAAELRDVLTARLVDLGIALAWFAVLAVVGGLVWWQVTPLAAYTRTATNAVMDEEQLGIQVNADGWFFVIAAVAGLLSGVVLLSWRRRDPISARLATLP